MQGTTSDDVDRIARFYARVQSVETDLASGEARFRALVNGLPDTIVWEADADTVDFQFVSPSAEAILGYPVSAWYEERPNFWVNHLHPEDRDRCVSFCKTETAAGRDHEFDYRMIARDGRIVWMRDRAYCVRDESGKIVKLRGLMIDVTRQKTIEAERAAALEREREARARAEAAETALRQLNATLEERVRDRTSALEQAHRELETFSAAASHDLRSALRHIASFAELLERRAGGLDDVARSHVHEIRGASIRAGQLVDRMLELARLGHVPLREEPVDLDAIVRDAIAELAPTIGARRVDFDVSTIGRVRGDREMISIVVRNLLQNAVKFTAPRPAAKVEVRGRREGLDLVVTVRDDGVGFDPQYTERLFQPFTRLHAREDFEGHGVGLASVRRLIERHRGRVWARSEPGAGAEFSFAIPAAEEGGAS